MRLFLDDLRDPQKHGFEHSEWARNFDEAVAMLERGDITFASLDHDIGACPGCSATGLHIGSMTSPETTFYNFCPHVKSGYDVVLWMDSHDAWPVEGVHVHSANPVGRERMERAIERHYRSL